MWVTNLCRICGQISETTQPIFTNDANNEDLAAKIKKCLHIDVSC